MNRPATTQQRGGPSGFAERFILTYKEHVSPYLGSRCRYTPTCSEYGLESFRRFGFAKATAKTAWRLLRCNPFQGREIKEDPP